MKTVEITMNKARKLTAAERAELDKAFAAPIDYSDVPAVTDEDIASGKLVLKRGGARPGAGRKPAAPGKKLTTLTVDFLTAKVIREKAAASGVTIDEFLRCRFA